jgi:hypothetical protein
MAEGQKGGDPEHKCLDIIEYQTKVRLDLRSRPGSNSLWMDPIRYLREKDIMDIL